MRATPSVCSRDSTVHGPAISANVSAAPIVWPSTAKTVGSWWASSDEASLYGREIGTTRSTPSIPSSPSSRTPSGSPIAPIAVTSSPGSTSTCTPVVSSRARTAAISASRRLGCHHDHHKPELPDAELVGPQVVRQLVAHGPRDLRAQLVGVVPEVAQQRVAEDDDAVGHVVARDGVALVETVGAVAPALVGDHDGDVLERAQQQVGQVVERLAHQLLEVGRVARVERDELALVRLGREVLAREPLAAAHELLELLLVGRVRVVGEPAGDGRDHDADQADRRDRDRERLQDRVPGTCPTCPRNSVMTRIRDAQAERRRGDDPPSVGQFASIDRERSRTRHPSGRVCVRERVGRLRTWASEPPSS